MDIRKIPLPSRCNEDGTAAVTHKSYGGGHAYAIGVDVGFLLLRGHNNRGGRPCVEFRQSFRPGLGCVVATAQGDYTVGEPHAVTIGYQ
jgi:hypothetical protein